MSSSDEQLYGLNLHKRLLANDPVASLDVHEYYNPRLYAHLKKKYPQVDPHLLADAATDACFNYINRPTAYDPAQRSLFGYLKMSADGDVHNALAKQKRRQKRLVSLEVVELFPADGNNTVEEEIIAREEAVGRLKDWQQRQTTLANEITDSPTDRKLLHLLQTGVKKTQEYAAVLGIEQLSLPEQRRIVKQHKDRLRVRLKRHKSEPSAEH